MNFSGYGYSGLYPARVRGVRAVVGQRGLPARDSWLAWIEASQQIVSAGGNSEALPNYPLDDAGNTIDVPDDLRVVVAGILQQAAKNGPTVSDAAAAEIRRIQAIYRGRLARPGGLISPSVSSPSGPAHTPAAPPPAPTPTPGSSMTPPGATATTSLARRIEAFATPKNLAIGGAVLVGTWLLYRASTGGRS